MPELPELDVPVRLTSSEGTTPRYALPGDAGADLSLAEDVELAPFQRALVGTVRRDPARYRTEISDTPRTTRAKCP